MREKVTEETEEVFTLPPQSPAPPWGDDAGLSEVMPDYRKCTLLSRHATMSIQY